MVLISMGCRMNARVRVQGSMGMGLKLKLDPAKPAGLEESYGLP